MENRCLNRRSLPVWIVLLSAIGMPIIVGLLFLRVQLNGGMPDDPGGAPYCGL
jgi:hypothetical protein